MVRNKGKFRSHAFEPAIMLPSSSTCMSPTGVVARGFTRASRQTKFRPSFHLLASFRLSCVIHELHPDMASKKHLRNRFILFNHCTRSTNSKVLSLFTFRIILSLAEKSYDLVFVSHYFFLFYISWKQVVGAQIDRVGDRKILHLHV
jgi:hypothetical protein